MSTIYNYVDEINSPTKVLKRIYLFDLLFIVGWCGAGIMVGGSMVHDAVLIPYYIFNVVVAFILTTHSPWNPQKRIYQSIFYALRKDRNVYLPVSIAVPQTALEETNHIAGKEETT